MSPDTKTQTFCYWSNEQRDRVTKLTLPKTVREPSRESLHRSPPCFFVGDTFRITE